MSIALIQVDAFTTEPFAGNPAAVALLDEVLPDARLQAIAVEMNLFQQIDIMRRTLLSRPNLEKIILMTDLDLTVKSDEEKERLIDAMTSKIEVTQQGRNLFQIAYVDEERGLTKRVVQAVMQIFVEGNLGASRKDMETTRRFLEGQIRSYERQLVEAETRLAKFKRPRSIDFVDAMPREPNGKLKKRLLRDPYGGY